MRTNVPAIDDEIESKIIPNKMGKAFDSLAQRILYSYVAAYPTFQPMGESSIEAQKHMYEFMKETLLLLYENPALLSVQHETDDCYEAWELANTKPELYKSMEKIEGKFANFIEMLIKVGKSGVIINHQLVIPRTEWSIAKGTREKLEQLGISCEQTKEASILSSKKYPRLFEAWREYSEQDEEGAPKISRIIAFIHGRYTGKRYRVLDFFFDFIEDPELVYQLETFFEENEFELGNYDINNKTRYSYVKWLKEYPKKETAYMRAYFDWHKKNQMIFEFRIPYFREVLDSYEQMEEDLKQFIFCRLKTCDGCGYCTQMDKTGTRACLARVYSCGEQTLSKCPLYPWFAWNVLNEEDVKNLIRLFKFADTGRIDKTLIT